MCPSSTTKAVQVPQGSWEAKMPPGETGRSLHSRSPLWPPFLAPAASAQERRRRGLRTQHPPFCPPASVPVQRLKRCHPGLTKKRVELVPWSTAPTNGPRTAFFAAAMEISRLQFGELSTAGLRGDCGGLRRADQGEQRAKRRASAEGLRGS